MAFVPTQHLILSLHGRRAILAGAILPRGEGLFEDEEPLEELEQLVETAGADVVERVTQKLDRPFAGTYLGRGKMRQIGDMVKKHDVQVVLFDNDLSPAQVKNIEEIVGTRVLDRTEVILSIFAGRARTRQAALQVELAQLEYMLPRLRRMWTHLERQAGGIGLRGGPGERQIEVDRRTMRRRITDLQRQLSEIAGRTERRVKARGNAFNVSLVGYTNAGKSTLLNALTGSKAFVENRLFATLDTKTRSLELEGGHRVLISDTVGFIRKLPHHLVASFHATLEETLHADLLLHVVDASHAGYQGQIDAVDQVLKSIGADQRPTLVVFNKIDALTPQRQAELRVDREKYPESVEVSARTGEGLEHLKQELRAHSSRHTEGVTLSVPAADGAALSWISRHGFVQERHWRDNHAVLRVLMTPANVQRLTGQHPSVRIEG